MAVSSGFDSPEDFWKHHHLLTLVNNALAATNFKIREHGCTFRAYHPGSEIYPIKINLEKVDKLITEFEMCRTLNGNIVFIGRHFEKPKPFKIEDFRFEIVQNVAEEIWFSEYVRNVIKDI